MSASSAAKLLPKVSSVTSLSDKSEDVKKMGYLKKLKTMKKKFFVLHFESDDGPSRLEYYDNERKWKSGSLPKRSINLKTCLNINRRMDTKQQFVIALYTKDDCFAMSLDSEEELDQWLTALLELQHGDEYLGTDEKPKPNFEHVWQVNVKSKGLGSSKKILGPHRLCLTARTLTLIKMNIDCPVMLEFPLMSIRRCGHSDCFFFMEVGRSAVTGAGELWMLTEDTLIAQNMHEAILNEMKSSRKDDVAPRPRTRSSSANEASKPISVHTRRQQAAPIPSHLNSRERADSMPTRPRTVSDGMKVDVPGSKSLHNVPDHGRPRSLYSRTVSCSPPQNAISPSSGMYDSAGSSLSIDDGDSSQQEMFMGKYGHSLTEDLPMEPSIAEEVLTGSDSYMTMAPGEVDTSSGRDDPDGYMEMNPSTSLDYSLTPPGPSLPSTSPNVIQSRTPSLTGNPLWLNLGKSVPKSSSPPLTSSSSIDHYMEMSSPASNLSSGTPDGYMPMSPVGSSYFRQVSGSSLKSGHDEKEKPRNVCETNDGYVPMAPVKDSLPTILKGHSPQEDEGYMDMTPMSHSLPKTGGTDVAKELTPESFSRRSSATSGTPSADICFAEYQLDKVRAYFTPSEDDDEPIVRACSIGSRSDVGRKKTELEISEDSSRTRAFSMGSRVGVKFSSKISAAHVTNVPTSAASSSNANKIPQERGNKSSSAPLLGTSPLGNSWSGNSFLQRVYTANRNSSTNEDLMEMDFPDSKNCSADSLTGGMDNVGGWKSVGSSTDSLRRPPSSASGSRPRANSRSSHNRPNKMETLQSIGERSSSTRSPPPVESEGVSKSSEGDYAEMGTSATSLELEACSYVDVEQNTSAAPCGDRFHVRSTRAKGKLGGQLSLDYMDMNVNRSETEGGSKLGFGRGGGGRKQSLPVQIQGVQPKEGGRISPSNAGEYVNIDPSRGYPTNLNFSSAQPSWVPVGNVSTLYSASNVATILSSSSSSSTNTRLVNTNLTPATMDSRQKTQNPEYVNLHYGSSDTVPPPSFTGQCKEMGSSVSTFDGKGSTSCGSDLLSHEKASHSDKSGIDRKPASDYAVMGPINADCLSLTSPSRKCCSTPSDSSGTPDITKETLTLNSFSAPTATPISSPSVSRNSSAKDLLAIASSTVADLSSTTSEGGNSSRRPSNLTESPYENLSFAQNSRPNSVSSERELNYASLDLAPSTGRDEEGGVQDRSPRSPLVKGCSNGDSVAAEGDACPLSYAKIDFAKSEGLRLSSASGNRENLM